jgi:hypothetical protein
VSYFTHRKQAVAQNHGDRKSRDRRGMRDMATVFRLIVATALICAATPVLAENKCQYGYWNEEVAHVATLQDSRWQYRQLTSKEQERVVERYWFNSHERIDYPYAWIYRSAYQGLVEYSVIFTDDDGCIQFRLNVTEWTIR